MSYLLPSGLDPEKTEFFGTDTKKTFQINVKEFGADWIWSNRKITYNFNTHGYRMDKDLDKVDFDNYIAFFGCSNTVGSGLPLEDTFACQIASKCNMDYVNAAFPGASCDFVVKNFVELINKAPALPKIVVINWPEIARTCYWHKDYLQHFYPSVTIEHVSQRYWYESFKRYVTEDSHLKNQFEHNRNTVVAMCKLGNIKLFECSSNPYALQYVHPQVNSVVWPLVEEPAKKYSKDATSGLLMPTAEYIDWINKYFARDVMVTGTTASYLDKISLQNAAHPGLDHQKQIIDLFFNNIKL
jgi:hypothetical protein